MSDNVKKDDQVVENVSNGFDFVSCDTFNPDSNGSSASVMWYKAGETMIQ